MAQTNENTKIAIPTANRILMLDASDIVCFSYEGKHWHIYNKEGVRQSLAANIKAETILAYSAKFIQVTQSAILNIDYLHSIENNTLKCELTIKSPLAELRFSRTYYKRFCEQFLQDK